MKKINHKIELVKANKVEVEDILATFRVISETYKSVWSFNSKKELVSTETQIVELFYASQLWYEILPNGSLGREFRHWVRLRPVSDPDYLDYSIYCADLLNILWNRARRIKDQKKLSTALAQEKKT